MAYEKLGALVTRLHRRTVEGRVEWHETIEEGTYEASFSQYTVKIWKTPTREVTVGGEDYHIGIYNALGSMVEHTDDVDLDGYGERERPYFRMMKEMYETARRLVLGSEQAVSSILDELK